MKDYKGIKIEYHILQSFPVTCLNRDDVGSPKTAIVGGVTRGRVSSQCWKRQVRKALHESGIELAVRTRHLEEIINKNRKNFDDPQKDKLVTQAVKSLTSKDSSGSSKKDGPLFFISRAEVKKIANYIDTVNPDIFKSSSSKDKGKSKGKGEEKIKDEIIKAMKDVSQEEKEKEGFLSGLDIALFGRMVANAVNLNVEAACSFSHAITTHRISSEIDFFTALDDYSYGEEDAGSGHMGVTEYTSGTYYRYISLDLGLLADTLGDDADIKTAVQAFTKALYVAVPSAHQTTLAGYCPWNYAHVYVRKGQGMQLSFEKPVKASGEGYLEPSIEAMKEQLARNETLAGSLFGKLGDFIYGEDKTYSIDNLCVDINTVLETLKEA